MMIHVVTPGETLTAIAALYGVDPVRLRADNGVPESDALAVGQALLVRFPRVVHAVAAGETLFQIGQRYGVSVRQLLRRNIQLGGQTALRPGQVLVISYVEPKLGGITTNGYAYPYIRQPLLESTLPYMSYLTPFTYGINQTGGLLPIDDTAMLETAKRLETLPLLHLSSLTEDGQFSSSRSAQMLASTTARQRLVDSAVQVVQARGYQGIDVDYEYIPSALSGHYVKLVRQLRTAMAALHYPVFVALAPKTYAGQPGLLYEAHDYAGLGAAADGVLVMTYEWGYTYSHCCYKLILCTAPR